MIDRILSSTPNDWPPYVWPILIVVGAIVLGLTIWLQSTLVRWSDRFGRNKK